MKIKRFHTPSGACVLVGREDKANDYLTFKEARQHDLWFHVHGFPGSHVVLQSEGEHSKDDIRLAASCAAYYSKMRDGKQVAVSYCPVKNVSKRKGAKAGSVLIKEEKKVKVHGALDEALSAF